MEMACIKYIKHKSNLIITVIWLLIGSNCTVYNYYSDKNHFYSNNLLKECNNVNFTFKEKNNNIILNIWIPDLKKNEKLNYISVKINKINPNSYKINNESYIDTTLTELYNEIYLDNFKKRDVKLEYVYNYNILMRQIDINIEYQFMRNGVNVTKDTSFIFKRKKYRTLGLN